MKLIRTLLVGAPASESIILSMNPRNPGAYTGFASAGGAATAVTAGGGAGVALGVAAVG